MLWFALRRRCSCNITCSEEGERLGVASTHRARGRVCIRCVRVVRRVCALYVLNAVLVRRARVLAQQYGSNYVSLLRAVTRPLLSL